MSQYFPKPFWSFGENINVKSWSFKLCNKNWPYKCNTRWYFKFWTKKKLVSLKAEVDKLDIEKLAPVPVDLSKLSDVVKNDAAKETVYDKLPGKVNNIDTSDFVLKTKYQTGKTDLEKKIPDVTDFV